MSPLLLVGIANIVDILIGAITKKPDLIPHLGPIISGIVPILAQAAGETPEQIANRRASHDALIAQYANQPPTV